MNNIKTVKIFVIAATLVVLASLFNISCEKEQPTSGKSAVGYSERDSTEQQPQVAEVSQPKEMEPEEEEGVGSDESDEDEEDVADDLDEEEADEEDVADDLDEEEADEEDTGDTSDENEAESKE